jgi:hypothetical protein
VIFAYPNKADNKLSVTFYGDRVKEAMVLRIGDKVSVGFTLKSSLSGKGYWGTYATGIFLKVEERVGDAPNEFEQYERSLENGVVEVSNAAAQLGLDLIEKQDPDDLPF